MRVSIIIPTKDEPNVQELVDEINREIGDVEHEVIVVDKSEKKLKLRGANVLKQKSKGLAKAIIEGIENARYDRVIVMDGDFSHDPKDVKKLLKALKHSDLVIGSKYVKGARDESPLSRKLISRTANLLAKFLLGFKVKDCISGFFGFKKVRGIKLRGDWFQIEYRAPLQVKGKGQS